ncbi:MAG: M14 family zinc carboxypeptidase [Halieaceae bacterium]|nr:M14 family zinc carboxypeptidase [Halieaceae bacterium]
MKIQRALATLFVALFAVAAFAQEPWRELDEQLYPTDVSYDARIPTPEAFLGRPLGAAPVRHHELVDYIEAVAALSDRLTVEVAGYSHERRPILFVVATSAENQQRIDEIKARHVGLSEPSVDEAMPTDMPVVTWLNYGVHGAESSGMDASLPTIYYLAAAQGPVADRLLRESVILVTAVFNPDGHAYRAAWMDAYGSRFPNADPNHIEHQYDGRMARTNHYGFDLNRQWMSVTQPEARAWMRKWHEWRPNVSVDYHEMGSQQTYYFAPGVPTRTHPLIPAEAYQLISEVVAPSEAILDEQARLYFHGDRYDHFFLGKGAGFPLVNGGVGILHEASAARGVELETPNGIRTYRENILKHFRTSIGNAMGAVENRERLLAFQKSFYDRASERAAAHPVKAYVFCAPGDTARTRHLVDLLSFHRIEVYHLARPLSANGKAFGTCDAYIVPMDQPQHTLIRAMFDRMTEFEDKTFYDVSTWTVPLAFGVDHAPLSARQYNGDLLGAPASAEFRAAPVPDAPAYAYAFAWDEYYAPRALNRILQAGLHARVSLKPLAVRTTRGPVELGRGAVVVSFDRQPMSSTEIHGIVQSIAREDGVVVHSLISGRSAISPRGPDVGGQFFHSLSAPEVLLVTGRSMDWYNAGEIWHLLDQRMGMRVTLVDRDRLGAVDFHRYTHIVFAGGRFSGGAPAYTGRLRAWVDAGGTVIGIRQGARWLREQVLDYGSSSVATSAGDADLEGGDSPGDDASAEPERFPYAEKERRDPLQVVGGTIFAVDLDNTHPLGFGYAHREIAVMKNTSELMHRPANPYASVMVYATPPLLSGYASPENQDALAGTAALIAERKGSGSVILFADDPNFRGTWYGTNKLFMNALFFSTAFDPPRS